VFCVLKSFRHHLDKDNAVVWWSKWITMITRNALYLPPLFYHSVMLKEGRLIEIVRLKSICSTTSVHLVGSQNYSFERMHHQYKLKLAKLFIRETSSRRIDKHTISSSIYNVLKLLVIYIVCFSWVHCKIFQGQTKIHNLHRI